LATTLTTSCDEEDDFFDAFRVPFEGGVNRSPTATTADELDEEEEIKREAITFCGMEGLEEATLVEK